MLRRRLLTVGLALPCSAALAGCGSGAALDGLADGGVARVTEAVFGDALGLEDGRLLKLAGVEAPRGDAPHAETARAAVSALALGRRVSLLFAGRREDAYGRTLAHVRRVDNRLWLQGALLDAGAARVRTSADARALAKPMLAREAAARRAGRGLWALSVYRVRLPQELSPQDRGLQLVEGRVRRAGETRAFAHLDFSAEWRDEASVQIPSRALADFRAAGLDPLRLEGRLIRVRGDVQGLRLTVDHPEAIERLRDG